LTNVYPNNNNKNKNNKKNNKVKSKPLELFELAGKNVPGRARYKQKMYLEAVVCVVVFDHEYMIIYGEEVTKRCHPVGQ
jgi:hypothetical protein